MWNFSKTHVKHREKEHKRVLLALQNYKWMLDTGCISVPSETKDFITPFSSPTLQVHPSPLSPSLRKCGYKLQVGIYVLNIYSTSHSHLA